MLLRTQHSVPDFERWKRAFDADPMDRKGAGVRRYHVYRTVADPHLVMIDLELDNLEAATALLARLRELWSGPGGAVMRGPEAWILDHVESREP